MIIQDLDPATSVRPRGDGRLSSSFRHAGAGVRHVFVTQRNARIHVAITAAVVALGLWVRLTPLEWAVILVMVAVVFAAEMLNTAIEAAVDLATERYHPLARISKDAAAGAVLTSAVLAVLVGLLVLGPHLLQKAAGLVAAP